MTSVFDKALKRMREEAPTYNYVDEAQEELGAPGAMISGSKRAPEGQEVYWNACVFDEKARQIWHGDLNLTRRRSDLQDLANQIGTIHVTPENPFRWEGLRAGPQDRVVTYSQGGGVDG